VCPQFGQIAIFLPRPSGRILEKAASGTNSPVACPGAKALPAAKADETSI
jgi:hypothetical protein